MQLLYQGHTTFLFYRTFSS